jgi:hypothetical protein
LGALQRNHSRQPVMILLFGRAINQGHEVHGLQNGFAQSIIGSVNHFQ